MIECVLDSSAVVALIRAELGADQVAEVLDESMLCTVNLAEVVSVLVNHGRSAEEAARAMQGLPFTLAPFDAALALRTGTLHAATAHKGLSLGDRACLALAERERLPALTADRAWSDLDIGVEIRLLR